MDANAEALLERLGADVLGELAGLFAGDGTLYRTNSNSHAAEVRGSALEGAYYEQAVRPLFEQAFQCSVPIVKRYYKWGLGFVFGVRVCGLKARWLFHDLLGFPVGKKSRTVEIPRIVLKNKECWVGYIRGVFDTDGSFYVCKPRPTYPHAVPNIEIGSVSPAHREQVAGVLRELGFRCWYNERNSTVRLTGWKAVARFFEVIKPHNPTKVERFNRAMLGWPRTRTEKSGG